MCLYPCEKHSLSFTWKCIFMLTNDNKGLQAKPSVSSSIYPGGKLCSKGPSLMPTNYCPTWEQQIILNNNENTLVKTSHILENSFPRQRYVQNKSSSVGMWSSQEEELHQTWRRSTKNELAISLNVTISRRKLNENTRCRWKKKVSPSDLLKESKDLNYRQQSKK